LWLILLAAAYVAAFVLLAGAIWAASFPGSNISLNFLVVSFSGTLLAACAVTVFVGVAHGTLPVRRRTWLAWLGVAAIIAMSNSLAWGIVQTDLPLRARFELSRDAFNRAVNSNDQRAGSVGSFGVEGIWTDDDGAVHFDVAEAGLLEKRCGFAHNSSRPIAVSWGPQLDLGGGWSSYCYDAGW
jgi:hypothetical protein